MDGIEVGLPQRSGEVLTYEFPYDEIVRELGRIGVQNADKVIDFTFNFGRVIYEMDDGRYYYDPPEERSILLPAHNLEMRW